MKISKAISELTDNFVEISKLVHETEQPVFLTENGADDMVLVSIATYEELSNDLSAQLQQLHEYEVYLKLKEAELEEEMTSKRYTNEEMKQIMLGVIHKNV